MGKKNFQNVFRLTIAAVMCVSLLFPEASLLAASGEMEQTTAETGAVTEVNTSEKYDSIDGLSGDILYDTDGKRVMACGGEVHQFTEDGVTKWYWFGVDDLEKADGEQPQRGVHLYSSSDLYNWDYEGVIWDIQGAHPKVLYDEEQEQYVMWISLEQGVGVGTSSSIKGPFTQVSGSDESNIDGFINLYEESPGTAYAIYPDYRFSSGDIYMAQLSSDYTRIEGEPQAFRYDGESLENAEGGIFKRNGKYYVVNAGMTQYAVADSLTGTWKVNTLQMWDGTAYKNIVDKNQTSNVFHVKTENTDQYICVGDSVGGDTEEVRYIWLPIVFFGSETVALRELNDWKLDAVGGSGDTENLIYDSISGLADKPLYDTEGREIKAYGGEVHQFTENGVTKWYWFGESFSTDGEDVNEARNLHLYSSTDLYNWTREEDIFKGMKSKEQFETDEYFKTLYGDLSDSEKDTVFECLKGSPTAHPKVLYNEKQQQYVMWVPGANEKECIAVSDSIKGPFKFVKYCDSISGFVTMYRENDGSAYIIYQDADDLFIARLTDDYMDVEGTAQSISFDSEEKLSSAQGGMFRKNGKYYMVNVGSQQYAVADSLTGAWTVHPLEMCDDKGQISGSDEEDSNMKQNPTSHILQVSTESGIVYINIADSGNGTVENQARYVWLPIKFFGDGTIALEKLSNWKLEDVKPEEPDIPEQPGTNDSIDGLSGDILYDTEGRRVMTCGGEVHQVEEDGKTKWYWFGVNDLETDGQEKYPGIHLYSSTDLYNWEYEGTMGELDNTIPIAHPKMLYNEKQQQYVMWVEVDGGGMKVAVSKSIKGPFTIVDGAGESGITEFINLFKDSDDTAYIIYSEPVNSENNSLDAGAMPVNRLFMAKLADDYTRIEGMPQELTYATGSLSNAEGGVFKRNGKYYIVNAGNPDDAGPRYAVADSLDGPWTVQKIRMWDNEKQQLEDLDRQNQTSNVFHVKTQTTDVYVCVGDSVNSEKPEEARYIWLPIKFFEDDTIALEKLSNWKLESRSTESEIEVTEVKLSDTDKTLKIGEKYQIEATVLPSNATDKTLVYKSSDDSVVSVSAVGEVEAKKAGAAMVTVMSVNGKTAQLQVTVEKAEEPGEPEKPEEPEQPKEPEDLQSPVEVIEVKLSEAGKTLKIGEKYQIEATVLPSNATDKTLTYKSSDDSVASVSAIGEVEAKKAGTATVTVTSVNGKTAQLQVTVEQEKKTEVQKVLVSANKMTVGVGEKVQLEAAVYPGNAFNKVLTYKSSNNKVKVNKKGMLTAQKTGSCKITISASNNKKVVVKVTVKKKPTGISLNANKKTLKVGKKYQIKTKLPKGTASYKLTYTSSKKSVAAVSQTGKVTAKRKGDAIITVKTYNGKKAVLKIHVK